MRPGVAALLFTLALCGAPKAFAMDSAPDIVEVYGNSVYDDDTILREAGLVPGNPEPPDDEIRRRLLASGMFSRVRLTREDHALRIAVHEKTPSFAVPYFSSSSERKYFGLAAGLLGMGEGATQMLGRYQLGTGDHEAAVYFLNEYLGASNALITGTVDYESALHDEYFGGRDVVRSFSNWQVNGAFGLGYHFTPDVLVELDSHLELHRFEQETGLDRKGTQVSHRFFGVFGAFFVNEGLATGWHVKPYVELTNPASSFDFQQWGFFAEIAVLRSGSFNWIMRPNLEQGNNLPRYQQFELGGTKLRGYSAQSFRSDHYSRVQNDVYLFAFPLFKSITMRPFAFFDWAYVENGGRPGAGLGVRAFFRDVAVPALELAAGYGTHPAGISVAASIGPQF